MTIPQKSKFPFAVLEGTPHQVGLAHGTQFKDRIVGTISFYKNVFDVDEALIFSWAEHFKNKIFDFDSAYNEEIEGIAQGACVNPLWVYALNARSEILAKVRAINNECTSVYFRNSSVLGQNWDWGQALESLAILLQINHADGRKLLTITEPGFLGKTGLNSAGVGVCVNSLRNKTPTNGVPLHVILRAVLDSTSFDEAMLTVARAKKGKVGNILLGDDSGNYSNFEFAGNEIFSFHNDNSVFLHTNHYLGRRINKNPVIFASSFARYKRGKKIIQSISDYTVESMKEILLDKKGFLPICRCYHRHPRMDTFGTVCTIIMDLPKREMHITKGNPSMHVFETVKLQKPLQ